LPWTTDVPASSTSNTFTGTNFTFCSSDFSKSKKAFVFAFVAVSFDPA
jgi:hypothetical protein